MYREKKGLEWAKEKEIILNTEAKTKRRQIIFHPI